MEFRHHLALALGMTVAEVEKKLTAREYLDWMRYARRYPFGGMAAWMRWAQAMAIYCNAHRDAKKGRAWTMEDFMPREEKKQTVEEQMAIFRGLGKARDF